MSNDELVELLKRDENPSLALQMAAVWSNPRNISFIEKQLPEVCLAAVKQCGWILKYVKEQNSDICLAAVKQNRFALDYVKDTKMRKWVISQLE